MSNCNETIPSLSAKLWLNEPSNLSPVRIHSCGRHRFLSFCKPEAHLIRTLLWVNKKVNFGASLYFSNSLINSYRGARRSDRLIGRWGTSLGQWRRNPEPITTTTTTGPHILSMQVLVERKYSDFLTIAIVNIFTRGFYDFGQFLRGE